MDKKNPSAGEAKVKGQDVNYCSFPVPFLFRRSFAHAFFYFFFTLSGLASAALEAAAMAAASAGVYLFLFLVVLLLESSVSKHSNLLGCVMFRFPAAASAAAIHVSAARAAALRPIHYKISHSPVEFSSSSLSIDPRPPSFFYVCLMSILCCLLPCRISLIHLLWKKKNRLRLVRRKRLRKSTNTWIMILLVRWLTWLV